MLEFAAKHPFVFIFALLILAGVVTAVIKYVFDFIVELIHGKPVVQNLNIPVDKIEELDPKDLSLNKKDKKIKKDSNDSGFDSDLKMNIGKVEVFKKDK